MPSPAPWRTRPATSDQRQDRSAPLQRSGAWPDHPGGPGPGPSDGCQPALDGGVLHRLDRPRRGRAAEPREARLAAKAVKVAARAGRTAPRELRAAEPTTRPPWKPPCPARSSPSTRLERCSRRAGHLRQLRRGNQVRNATVQNTTSQTLCYVQAEPHLKSGTQTVGELGPDVLGDLNPGQQAVFQRVGQH